TGDRGRVREGRVSVAKTQSRDESADPHLRAGVEKHVEVAGQRRSLRRRGGAARAGERGDEKRSTVGGGSEGPLRKLRQAECKVRGWTWLVGSGPAIARRHDQHVLSSPVRRQNSGAGGVAMAGRAAGVAVLDHPGVGARGGREQPEREE